MKVVVVLIVISATLPFNVVIQHEKQVTMINLKLTIKSSSKQFILIIKNNFDVFFF